MSQPNLQAHCQSPTSQRYNQSFVKELAKPAQKKNFKISLPLFKEKIKTRQHTGDTDIKENETNDKFNMKVQFDSDTRADKNRQCITRYIKNWADTTEIKGCSSLQTLYRFDNDVFRSAQLFIYRDRQTV